ncbi:MAG: hypothetical protein EBT42_01910 [Actinobacteria bacterium]|nr:hypothetical protein [Actinomycetota bacterium]
MAVDWFVNQIIANITSMISAVVWHWWLGAGLLIAGIGAVLSLVAGYVKQVTALKYPNRRQRQAQK